MQENTNQKNPQFIHTQNSVHSFAPINAIFLHPLHRHKCSSHKLHRPSISAGFGFIFLCSEILAIWYLVNKEYLSLKYLNVVVTPETFSGETKARNIKL